MIGLTTRTAGLAILRRSITPRLLPVRVERSLTVESLRRTIDVCSVCGSTIASDDDGPCCDGAEIETVEVWSPAVALGLLDGSRRSLEYMGLVGRAAS